MRPPLILVCLALILVPRHARAEEYRDDAAGFRLQTPENWVRFAPPKLAQVRNAIGQKPDTKFHHAFEPADLRPAADGSTAPFMFVMEMLLPHHKRKPGYDELEKILNNEFRRGFEGGAAATQTKLGAITLDRPKNHFFATFESTAPNGLKIKGSLHGFLGKDNIVVLAYFSRASEFAQYQPAFDRSADTFRFDPGFQYEPTSYKMLWIALGGAAGTVCCIGVVGLILIIVVVMKLTAPSKKKKKRRRRY